MELMTKINTEPVKEKITYNNKILMVGSCFADEIGTLLKTYDFDILTNPFGTLYNPASVIHSLERMASCQNFIPEEIINTGLHMTGGGDTAATNNKTSKYCSFFHHSSFARDTPDAFLEDANHSLRQASEFLKKADTIIITLGTAWVFRHTGRNQIVSNCHKIHPGEFVREFLGIQKITSLLQNFISKYPDKKYIFTVSPIRHLKDGAHGNQISKATLLLAVNELVKNHPEQTAYFPAYEILLDELRDYRFYAEDMIHPSGQAIQYIFERFKELYIAPAEYETMQKKLKKYKTLAHRPILK